MSRVTDRYAGKAGQSADRQLVQAEYRTATQRKLQHFATQQERIDAFRQRAAAQSGNRRQAVSGHTEQYRAAHTSSSVVQTYAGRAPQQQQQLQQSQGKSQGFAQ